MSGNTFGKLFSITTFGESHGEAIGCVIDGCPPGLKIEEKDIEAPSSGIKKKQKTGEHLTKGNKVLNTDPNPEYKMLEGEDFRKVYCGKNAQFRPFWDKAKGTKMCPRFIQNGTVSTTAT